MYRAEVRNGHVYVIDTSTGTETHIYVPEGGAIGADVTGDDELTIRTDYAGGFDTKYRISTDLQA